LNTPSPPSGDMTLVTSAGLTKAKVTCLAVSGSSAVIVGSVTKGIGSMLRFTVQDNGSRGAGHDRFKHDSSCSCYIGGQGPTITQGNLVVEDPPLLPPLAAPAPAAALLP